MRAAVYYGRRDIRVEDVPRPRPPREGEVLLQVVRASICGTDVAEYLHGPHMIPLARRHPASGHLGPLVIGHEFVGRIVDGGGASSFQPGARVVVGAGVWCGDCARCSEGRPNLCSRSYTIGLHAPGGLAEMVLVPERMCTRVPADLPDDHAALAQPMAIALHALRRADPPAAASTALIGAGGIGTFILAALAARGIDPVAIDISQQRLSTAARLAPGARLVDPTREDAIEAIATLTNREGADLVIEASGSPAGLHLAIQVVRRGGRLLLVGLQSEPQALDMHDLVVREIDVITSNAHVCDVDLPEAVAVLAASHIGAAVIDRVIGLDDLVPDGIIAMAEGRVRGKVMVDPMLRTLEEKR